MDPRSTAMLFTRAERKFTVERETSSTAQFDCQCHSLCVSALQQFPSTENTKALCTRNAQTVSLLCTQLAECFFPNQSEYKVFCQVQIASVLIASKQRLCLVTYVRLACTQARCSRLHKKVDYLSSSVHMGSVRNAMQATIQISVSLPSSPSQESQLFV